MAVGERFNEGRYTALYKLGQGHYATVWMVLDSQTGQELAMKASWAVGLFVPALLPLCSVPTALPACLSPGWVRLAQAQGCVRRGGRA